MHFSNYTVTTGPDVDEIIERGVADMTASQLETWLNRHLLEDKKNGTGSVETFQSYFKQVFEQVVKPSVEGINSCYSASSAFEHYLSWSRMIQLLDGGDESAYFSPGFETGFVSLLKASHDECYELAKKACYQDHEPIELQKYILSIDRQHQILGMAEDSRFAELARKCGQFKFYMESDLWGGTNASDKVGVTAKAEFDFSLNFMTSDPVTGKIEVVDTYLKTPDMICTKTGSRSEPVFMEVNNFLVQEMKGAKNFTVTLGNLVRSP